MCDTIEYEVVHSFHWRCVIRVCMGCALDIVFYTGNISVLVHIVADATVTYKSFFFFNAMNIVY